MKIPKNVIVAIGIVIATIGGLVAYLSTSKLYREKGATKKASVKCTWQVGIILSLIFALVANYMVGAQVLNLPSIGVVSDRYSTYLTPASYAFSIWSLIYLLLVVLVVYQARDIFKPSADNQLPMQIGPLFVISSIMNGIWTYVFVSEMVGLSVIVLLLLTASLYALLWRLRIALDNLPLREIACVWWPLLIYTGWVTVASVVNIASWLDSLGVMLTPLMASIVLILLAAALTWLLVKRNVRELLLACVWGVVAIGVQQMEQSGSQVVAVTAFTTAGLLTAFVAVHAYINRRSNPFGKIMRDVGLT